MTASHEDRNRSFKLPCCVLALAALLTLCPPRLFRRPSGRLEVVQLIKMMDNMVLKAGVDQQSEELTELSQVTH